MRKKTFGTVLLFSVMLLGGILFLVPVILTIIGSFMQNGELSASGYATLFLECFPFYRMFWNSVMYAVLITIGAIVIAIPAACAFKFAHFKGKNLLYLLYIVLMLMPIQVMVLPNYIGLRDMNILNTPFAIILPLFFSPLAVVVIHQYLKECDTEVVAAVRLETNSVLRAIWHCVIPQIKVCIFAVGLFIFAETWNLVEQPLLYLNDDKWKNLSLLFSEKNMYQAEAILPAAVLFMVPVIFAYLLFKDELNRGIKV